MGIAWNEISAKANGGTEQTMRFLEAQLGSEIDDFFIIPSRVRELDMSKYRIYHVHDTAADPECSHLKDAASRGRFHKIVFCGNFQRTTFQAGLGVPIDDHSVVIETPVVPIDDPFHKRTDEIRLVYTSTPQRGLDILVPVFIELAKKYSNLHLDVFSSFKIYGFDEMDKQFEPLYKICNDHPQITYHGVQPNDVVRNALKHAHILAYPSTWVESCSRSLIEAMSAGLACVHSDLGGLPDTSGNLTSMYSFTPDKMKHCEVFYRHLESVIDVIHQEEVINTLRFTKAYADCRFGADRIVQEWKVLLHNIREEYQGRGIVLPKDEVIPFSL